MPNVRYIETPMGITVVTDNHTANIAQQSLPGNYKEELTKPEVMEALLQKVSTEGALSGQGQAAWVPTIEWPTK